MTNKLLTIPANKAKKRRRKMTIEEFKNVIKEEGFDKSTLRVNGGRFVLMPTACENIVAVYLMMYLHNLGLSSTEAVYSCTISESDATEFGKKLRILISWLKPEIETFQKRMIERLNMFKATGKISDWS